MRISDWSSDVCSSDLPPPPPPPARRLQAAGSADRGRGAASFDLPADPPDTRAQRLERLPGLLVDRQEAGGLEEAQQRPARIGVVGGPGQPLLQAFAPALVEVAACPTHPADRKSGG